MALAGLRRRRVEEEGESVFVSMTDLTVSVPVHSPRASRVLRHADQA